MANGGWWASDEERELAEAPLLGVDQVLTDFAEEFGLSMTKNSKDWPERSFRWEENGVGFLIQLYLKTKELQTFNLWFCASQDRNGERFWKEEMPIESKRIETFSDSLPSLLRDGRKKLLSWTIDDLEFATKLMDDSGLNKG